jgi:hypothetical protein
MATYSVYLKHDAESELISSAKKLGISPIDPVRNRITQGATANQTKAANRKMNAIIQLIEMMIPELAYTAGASRAASAGMTSAVNKGNSLEEGHKKAAELIRARLERFVGDVVL